MDFFHKRTVSICSFQKCFKILLMLYGGNLEFDCIPLAPRFIKNVKLKITILSPFFIQKIVAATK